MINYFNFKKMGSKFLLTNDLGRYLFVSPDELRALLQDKPDDPILQERVSANGFWYDGSAPAFVQTLVPYLRDSKQYLFAATSLHIFVVTNACNMQCRYCQAHGSRDFQPGMMNRDVAQKAVDIALSSPSAHMSFEFQGGEPLLNFDVIRFIVEYTEQNAGNKKIDFNLVSNLTLLNDEMVSFLSDHHIGVSTSLDGPEALHNHNRPYRKGGGTFADAIAGIERLHRGRLGCGAIQTTTRASLSCGKDIVDTYVQQGMPSVFIRSLTPLGCAREQWDEIGYTPAEFLKFYRECFDYILELNREETFVKEGHAAIFLSKILTGVSANYMELRSPCGAGVGQMAYYYDGNVYTCDEGRMLAEMGNDAFKMGTVEQSFQELICCDSCKAACVASTLESLPQCCDCVYHPYCGTCPVVNFALSNDIYNREPNDYRCQIYKGILDVLFEALQDPEKEAILKTWI